MKKAVRAVVKVVKKVAKTVARAAVSTAHWVAKHSKVITQVGLAVAAVALTVVNVAQLGLDPVTDAAEAADVGALAAADSAVREDGGEERTACETSPMGETGAGAGGLRSGASEGQGPRSPAVGAGRGDRGARGDRGIDRLPGRRRAAQEMAPA